MRFLLELAVILSTAGEASMAKQRVPREQVFGCCSQVINNWQKHPKSGGFDKQNRRIGRQDYLLAGAAFLAGAFLAGAFFAGVFFAGAFLAADFFTVVAFLAGAFLTGAFLAALALVVAFLAGFAAMVFPFS